MELADKIQKEEKKIRILREKQKASGVGLWDDGELIPVMEKFSPWRQTHVFAQHRDERK